MWCEISRALGVLPAPRGLAAVRSEVLAQGIWRTTAIVGGIVMGKKTLVVVVAFVLALSGAAYWSWHATRAPEVARARALRTEPEGGEPAAPEEQPATSASELPDPS